MGVPLEDIATVVLRAPKGLRESSGAVMSNRQPGVLFTINDSGNEPDLFAVDTTGVDRGAWRIRNARNVDWESLALGACVPGGRRECLYIGDTGDNSARRPSRRIYRVREPDVLGARDTLSAEELEYSYSDGPHDVEAMYVAPNANIILITKRPLANASGVLRRALVFVLPARAWAFSGRSTAMLVDSLPIVPGSALLRTISDAALSPDGKHLAVRTYGQIYVFRTDSLTGLVDHGAAPAICNLVSLDEEQGEGLAWMNNDGRFVFTSEGERAPLHFARCPVP